MATISEPLETATTDQFASSSKALVADLAVTPAKAAKILVAKSTFEKEMESLRHAAREVDYTLSIIRGSERAEQGDNLLVSVKLGPKVIVPTGLTRNRGGKDKPAEDAPAAVPAA